MFSYVFMKILEGMPRSYDRLMNRVSRGRIREVKESVAAEVPPGSRILEIGCGTGELAALLIARGTVVDGFDSNPAMVRVAEERIDREELSGRFTVREMGVSEMDSLPESTYDVVVSTLVLSELSDDERRYALRQSNRVLEPQGTLVIADEVVPRTAGRKLVHILAWIPLLAVTYLVSRTYTRPLVDINGDLSASGFIPEKELRSHGDAFALVVARKGAR